jgi:hypothetical protein
MSSVVSVEGFINRKGCILECGSYRAVGHERMPRFFRIHENGECFFLLEDLQQE